MADDGAAGVYVRAAVLAQLERDKRELRRQVASARQQAEVRATAASASEARAADLLAILELNRSGAERALEQLRSAKDAQRRAFAGSALRTLLRHLAARRLRRSLERWRLHARRRPGAAGPCDARAERPPAAECAFAFDECFRLRFARRRELRAVAFAAWRWLVRQRRLRLAACRRRRARLQLAACVGSWRSWRGRRALARAAVAQLGARRSWRALRTAWATLRHACVRESAALWVQALDAARRAVDEEREQLTAERCAALKQAEDAEERGRGRERRRAALFSHKLASLARDDLTLRCFSRWKLRAAQAVRTRAAALRLARPRHWQRRRAFGAWRAEMERSRAIRGACDAVATQTARRKLASAFKALATHARAVERQRTALRRTVRRLGAARALARAWTRWRVRSTLESQRLLASYDAQQLADRFEARAAVLQHELQRASKLRRQAQLACALHKRERRRELAVRSVMARWALVARASARRKRHLRRLLTRTSDRAKRRAISQWRQRADAESRRLARAAALQRRCTGRRVRELFSAWHVAATRDQRVRLARSLEALTCRVDAMRRFQAEQRAVALHRLLRRTWLVDARRRALRLWRRRVEQQARRGRRAVERRSASLAAVWAAWTRYCRHRLRARARQYHVVLDKSTRREQSLTRKRVLFTAWSSQAARSRSEHQRISQQFAALRRGRQRLAAVLERWRHWSRDTRRRRSSLLVAVCRHRLRRVVRLYWQQWARHTVIRGIRDAQRRAECVAEDRRRACLLRFLSSRRRQLMRTLVWREWAALATTRRRSAAKTSQLVTFIERQGRLKLRRECFRRWRGDVMALGERTRRALRVLLHTAAQRQTLRAFRDWQSRSRALAVSHLADKHAQAKRLAQERIATVTAAKRDEQTTRRAFAAWRVSVSRQLARRRHAYRLMRRYSNVRARVAWAHWLVLTRATRHLDRLGTLWSRGAKRMAWARLVSSRLDFMAQQQRLRKLRFVVGTWRRWQLRGGWHDWKAQVVAVARRAQQHAHQQELAASVSASVLSLQLHWASLWHRRSAQRHVLRCWRAHVKSQRLTRDALHAARLERMAGAMDAWRAQTNHRKGVAPTLLRLARSVERHKLRRGMARWRARCHASQVASVRHAALARVLSPPSPSSLRALNTGRPWLAMPFAAWRSLCARRWRQSLLVTTRHCARLTRSTFRAWRQAVWTTRELAQLQRGRERRVAAALFRQWKERSQQHRQRLNRALGRLVLLVQRSLWLQGWQALRANHRGETLRRQSALAFQSAQSVIAQHRSALAMRGAVLMLARRQRLDASALFHRWKSFVATRQRDQQLDKATSARMARFRARTAVAKWHIATQLEMQLRRNVLRWDKARRRQRLQRCWRALTAFVAAVRARERAMTGTIKAMLARSVGYRVKRAWRTWRASTAELRDLERQRRLDASNEHVLLLVSSRSEAERQHAAALRRRSFEFFVATLAQVTARALQSNAQFWKARALDRWRNSIMVVQHRVIANLVAAVAARVRLSALSCWREFARHQRAADETRQHRQLAFERAAVLFASATTQTRKRRVMLTWQVFVAARRMKQRRRALVVSTMTRGLDRATRRRCFRSWTRYVHVRVDRRRRLSELGAIRRRRTLRLGLCSWLQWCDARTRLQRGAYLLARVCRRSDAKLLTRRWRQWRHWMLRAAASVDQCDGRETLLRHIFRAWASHLLLQSERLAVFERRRLLRALIACFSTWKRLRAGPGNSDAGSGSARLKLFPVGPSRRRAMATAAASHPGRLASRLCGYRRFRVNVEEMERRRRRAWAALGALERIALAAQERRQSQRRAVARLGRSLRRQHRRVLTLALWTWLARVQTVAPSLWAASLSAAPSAMAPPLRPSSRDGDVTARVAAILLRDLVDARAQFHRKCWRVAALAVRTHRCWWLRRGFERLRTAVAVHRRAPPLTSQCGRSSINGETHHSTRRTRLQAAAARAVLDRLSSALLRAFFREWKAQYVAAALREAQAAHDALLLALHDAALGRQALDPLRRASPASISVTDT